MKSVEVSNGGISIHSYHNYAIQCLCFSKDGRELCSASVDGAVVLWNVENRHMVCHNQPTGSRINYADFSPDTNSIMIATGDKEGKLLLWKGDSKKGTMTGTVVFEDSESNFEEPMRCVRFSWDGELLMGCCGDGIIRFWDITKSKNTANIFSSRLIRHNIKSDFNFLRSDFFGNTRDVIVSGGSDGLVKIFDYRAKKDKSMVENPIFLKKLPQTDEEAVRCVRCFQNTYSAVIASGSKCIDFHEIDFRKGKGFNVTKTTNASLSESEHCLCDIAVCDVDFHPSGRYAISCSARGECPHKVLISDCEDGKIVYRKGGSSYVNSVRFKPDVTYGQLTGPCDSFFASGRGNDVLYWKMSLSESPELHSKMSIKLEKKHLKEKQRKLEQKRVGMREKMLFNRFRTEKLEKDRMSTMFQEKKRLLEKAEEEKERNLKKIEELEEEKKDLGSDLSRIASRGIISEKGFDPKKDEEKIRSFKNNQRLTEIDSDSLIPTSFVGGGVFASCFVCRVKMLIDPHEKAKGYYDQLVVAKFLKSEGHSKSSEEMVKREKLRIEYHKNVVSIITSNPKFEMTEKLEDELNLLMGIELDEKTLFMNGVVIMNHFNCSLDLFLRTRTTIKVSEMCYIMKGILEGLQHLKNNKVCHRDLHDGNIFLQTEDSYSRVCIGDFNIAIDFINRTDKNKNMIVNPTDGDFDELIMDETSVDGLFETRVGGCSDYLPDDIRNYKDHGNELDYSKCDMYSAGVIGKGLLKHLDPSSSKDLRREIEELFGKMVETKENRIDYREALIELEGVIKKFE